jgi:hypothetical protein
MHPNNEIKLCVVFISWFEDVVKYQTTHTWHV